MKNLLSLIVLFLMLSSCEDHQTSNDPIKPINWKQRTAKMDPADSLKLGSTYLAVYSEIYSISEHRSINLTVTASIRNISSFDTIYIRTGQYYNTKGDLIRSYFDTPIYLKPLETIEIIIDEKDTHGGSGANFVFEWAHKQNTPDPVFDAVMISTSGQQGISFTTQGKKR